MEDDLVGTLPRVQSNLRKIEIWVKQPLKVKLLEKAKVCLERMCGTAIS